MTLPAGTVRRVPRNGRTHSEMVRLYTADEHGDLQEGFIDLPLRLCRPEPHSNEYHEQQRVLGEATARWVAWKAKKGWVLNSKPRWRGPYELPTSTARAKADWGKQRYFVTAKFQREYPLWIPMDAYDYLFEQSSLYDIDLRKPRAPWTELSERKGADVIDDDRPVVDPLKEAEERRQELGLSRKDYLWGPLSEPITNPYEKPLLNEVKLDEE